MLFEESQIVVDSKKPFLVFCHHDTLKDFNGIHVPTHLSMLTFNTDGDGSTFAINTNAIYCQHSGQVKFNNGYPPLQMPELINVVQGLFTANEIDAVQIMKSRAQLYFVREFLKYKGPVIQVQVEQPFQGVTTAAACISLANHNTFSCSHCLMLSIIARKLPGYLTSLNNQNV